jgi:DNA-directed RNA polymerase specialized sigma24 family protein
LESISPDAARVVNLRFYAGLTVEQTAAAAGLSMATEHRKWAYGRLFLFRELSTPKDF